MQDWEEPEKLLKGPDQYSFYTWREIYALMHELTHQKQAELNPRAFPELSLSDLDGVDPDGISRAELKGLLREAHKVRNRIMDNNSLFYPVVEGMAVVGSFYVMGRFIADLTKSGQIETAERVRQVRSKTIRMDLIDTKRRERTGKLDPYDLHYVEGIGMMRKLYKEFGIENTPRLLASVDLNACRGITKGSPGYQQIMDNPALLPGLQMVT